MFGLARPRAMRVRLGLISQRSRRRRETLRELQSRSDFGSINAFTRTAGSRALRFGVPVQALVTLRRTWPSVRLDHSGRQLGLVRATGQGDLILREPNGAAQV